MIDKITFRTIMTIVVVLPLLMCSNPQTNDSVNAKLDDMMQRQNLLMSRLEKLEKNQQDILKETKNITKTVSDINTQTKAIAQKSPAQNNNQKNQNNQNPSQVYDIPVGDSFVLGPADAKVTVTEWMDFQ